MRKMPLIPAEHFVIQRLRFSAQSLADQKNTVICNQTNSALSFSLKTPDGKSCYFVQSVKSSLSLLPTSFIYAFMQHLLITLRIYLLAAVSLPVELFLKHRSLRLLRMDGIFIT